MTTHTKPTAQLIETLIDAAVALENAISVAETEPGYADNLALRELASALRRAQNHLPPYVAHYPKDEARYELRQGEPGGDV